MTIVSSAAVLEQAEKLREIATVSFIPYVRGGSTLAGMDCQNMVEYPIIKAGVPRSECNLDGSNAHWRACVWRGTPEECVAKFGKVPECAAIFIVKEVSDTTPEKYRHDGLKDAEHMGIKLTTCALHASATLGKVAESKFADKTIKNGGWNAVGLLPWIDYGVGVCLDDAGTTEAVETHSPTPEPTLYKPVDVSGFYTIKRGCLGGAVRRLQTWLSDLGFDIGSTGVDGDFGRATEKALISFQNVNGLQPDGVAGQRTWAQLAQARADAMNAAKG